MRQQLITIVTGLVAGAIGATIVGSIGSIGSRSLPAPPPPPEAQHKPAPDRAVVVPPGWDPVYVGRLAQVERDVAMLNAAASNEKHAASDARDTSPVAERERDRAEAYEQDLDARETMLIAHDEEPIDNEWAETQSESARTIFEPTIRANKAALKGVDCRSKTCTVEVVFSNPAEGLAFMHSTDVPALPGMHGMSVTATPPDNAGAYALTMVYFRTPR